MKQLIYKTRPGYDSRNRCSFNRCLRWSEMVLTWHQPVGRSICEHRRHGRRHVQPVSGGR